MSYDVDILVPPVPKDDIDAWAEIELREGEAGEPSTLLLELHDRLTGRYPCISTLSDEGIDRDDTPWSSGPLLADFGPRVGRLAMRFDRARDALPFVIETAGALGLVAFDFQTRRIHRGDGLEGLTLTLEDDDAWHAPTPDEIDQAVDRLAPQNGLGFLVLDGKNGDYAQIGGGNGSYTIEWREHSSEAFRHFVAGEPGRPAEKSVDIAGNGTVFRVRENERMSAADAKAILRVFSLGSGRPLFYAWRDITEQFLPPPGRARPWWRFWG